MKYSFPLFTLLAVAVCVFSVGCNSTKDVDAEKKKSTGTSVAKVASDKTDKKVTKKQKSSRAIVKRGSLMSGSSGAVSTKTVSNEFSSADAVNGLFAVIGDATSFGPTLVIFCLDETPSAQEFVKSAADEIKKKVKELAVDDDKLLLAAVGFGASSSVLTDTPVATADDFATAVAKLGASKSESENGLAAVKDAYAKFSEYKSEKRYQILVVVISDEAPSDRSELDGVIETLSSDEIPVYVIGHPAPFGRQMAGAMNASEKSVSYGPETIGVERIDSDYWMDAGGMDALDSGFGPWAWERLCRKTQGRFLAVRPAGGMGGMYRSWPAASRQFEPSIMSRYAPDYGSEKDYLASLETNSAKKALSNAAKLSRTKFNMVRGAEIKTGDEAAMARQLLRIQQPIAAGLLPVKNLHDTLKLGEGDRDKLDSPRWKASYDLAMGRALSNFVRLDGANSMMAKAKSGMKFENPANNTWSLEASEEINTGGTHKRMAESATKYLQGLIDDYPDTPWAYVAEQELKSPMGWKWVEGN